jgi:hypothetical protein
MNANFALARFASLLAAALAATALFYPILAAAARVVTA